jgi:hypothetical protein
MLAVLFALRQQRHVSRRFEVTTLRQAQGERVGELAVPFDWL